MITQARLRNQRTPLIFAKVHVNEVVSAHDQPGRRDQLGNLLGVVDGEEARRVGDGPLVTGRKVHAEVARGRRTQFEHAQVKVFFGQGEWDGLAAWSVPV